MIFPKNLCFKREKVKEKNLDLDQIQIRIQGLKKCVSGSETLNLEVANVLLLALLPTIPLRLKFKFKTSEVENAQIRNFCRYPDQIRT